MTTKLEKQLRFLAEADKLKNVLRRTVLTDKSRRENDAEHSWHFALFAMVMREYMDGSLDMEKVLKLAAIHDLAEIYAGDVFAYDTSADRAEKAKNERLAAEKLFSLLPDGQQEEFLTLFLEFDACLTPESRYANALDRMQPFLNNVLTDGHTWREGDVSKSQVEERMRPILENLPRAYQAFIAPEIKKAIEKGQLRDE